MRLVITLIAVMTVLVSCSTAAGVGSDDPDTGDAIGLRPVDGGIDYFGRFIGGLPVSADFVPVGVWAESVVDDTGWPRDKALGLNVYVAPTPDTDLSLIDQAGMYALPSVPQGKALPTADLAGFATVDEVDMWAGPGSAPWTGNHPGNGDICIPADARCGYTVLETLTAPIPEDRMTFTNFGKGVTFWETDEEAARFVNDYQDVVSADIYWFTDPNVCGASEGGALLGTGEALSERTCRRASNYGATVERVRDLVDPAGRLPVWNFVEVGQPFADGGPAVTAPQIRAAVWSGFIHGARGVIYFNHSFGGDCASQHVLRDCDPVITSAVREINSQIARLAAVLNAPFVDGVVEFDDDLDGAARLVGSEFYLTVGSKGEGSGDSTITLRCSGARTAEVVDENREISIKDGSFVDAFSDGNSVHIYRLIGGDTCGLR